MCVCVGGGDTLLALCQGSHQVIININSIPPMVKRLGLKLNKSKGKTI